MEWWQRETAEGPGVFHFINEDFSKPISPGDYTVYDPSSGVYGYMGPTPLNSPLTSGARPPGPWPADYVPPVARYGTSTPDGGGGGGDYSSLSPEDYTVKSWSYSGIPKWLEKSIKRIGTGDFRSVGGTMGVGFGEAVDALNALRGAPENIRSAQGTLRNQFNESYQLPLNQAISGAIRRAAGQGIPSSSITGDWMQRIADEAQRSARGAFQDIDVWAEKAILENMVNRNQAATAFNNALTNLLGLTRYSTSESTNPTGILQLLAGVI